jgi:fructokinase
MPGQAFPTILCFGEVLWDCAPRGLFLGGAPANVAYHLARLGCRVGLVSGVGTDFLGDEILRRIHGWGIDTKFVARVEGKQTGVVLVDLKDPSKPAYEIVRDAAWDHMAGSAGLSRAASEADALVYGTLAVRERANLALLEDLLAKAAGLKVFDVNLRPPFIDRDLTLALASRSDLIKLNDEEIGILVGGAAEPKAQAAALAERTGCPRVCVTCGARGAGLWSQENWFWADARPIVVKDTIGAGDAYLAALTAGLLLGSQLPDVVLARAARLAEFVAASDGATPDYDGSDFAPA